MPDLNYNRLAVFVGFIVAFLGVEVLVLQNIEVPTELLTVLSTTTAALVGLATNVNKEVE